MTEQIRRRSVRAAAALTAAGILAGAAGGEQASAVSGAPASVQEAGAWPALDEAGYATEGEFV